MARIFITGGTGFLGSYILRLLVREGHEIYGIRRTDSRMDLIDDIKEKVHWIVADLNDVDKFEEVIDSDTIIIHAAAFISFNKKDQKQLNFVNVEATRQLVDVAVDKKVDRFIHISSIAALGHYHDNRVIDETIEWQDSPDHTTYGISKQMGEREVWRGQAEGLDIVILNPSLILGAGYWHTNSSSLIGQLDKGLPFYPLGMTGMVDVRDVAKLAVLAIQTEATGQRYIVSSENRTYKDYFEHTSRALGQPLPRRPLNKIWRALAWRGSGIYAAIFRKPQLITSQSMAASARSARYNNSKSRDAFNFQYTPIEKTWKDAIESFTKAKKEARSWGTLDLDGF